MVLGGLANCLSCKFNVTTTQGLPGYYDCKSSPLCWGCQSPTTMHCVENSNVSLYVIDSELHLVFTIDGLKQHLGEPDGIRYGGSNIWRRRNFGVRCPDGGNDQGSDQNASFDYPRNQHRRMKSEAQGFFLRATLHESCYPMALASNSCIKAFTTGRDPGKPENQRRPLRFSENSAS